MYRLQDKSRWLRIGLVVVVPLVLCRVLAEQASWRPRSVYQAGPGDVIWALAYSGDGRRLAIAQSTATYGQRCVVCDLATTRLRPLPVSGSAFSVALAGSPDGRTLAHGGTDDGLVRLWDVQTGRLQRVLPSTLHLDASIVLGVAFSRDGKTVVEGRNVGVVQVWDAATGRSKRTLFPGKAQRPMRSVWTAATFSPVGDTVATSDEEAVVRLWDTRTGQLRRLLRGAPATVGSLAFSTVGNRLASASSEGTVCLWALPGGQLLHQWKDGDRRPDTHYGSVVAVSPDGTLVAATGATGHQVRIWNATSGRLQSMLRANGDCLAFSPDSTTLATATWQGLPDHERWRVLLWRVR